jgi:hypothetical protein
MNRKEFVKALFSTVAELGNTPAVATLNGWSVQRRPNGRILAHKFTGGSTGMGLNLTYHRHERWFESATDAWKALNKE